MTFTNTEIDGVVVITPQVWSDGRGCFFETFSQREFDGHITAERFVQDNESFSRYGVVRGLHYQLPPNGQSKLVRVVRGVIRDVAVDIRCGSPTFGHYIAVELSAENRRQLFIPRGFAHGFSVLSEEAVVVYKCDSFYSKADEAAIAFDDSDLNIDWGVPCDKIIVSDKDMNNPSLKNAALFNYKG